jgi:hypothetical protein
MFGIKVRHSRTHKSEALTQGLKTRGLSGLSVKFSTLILNMEEYPDLKDSPRKYWIAFEIEELI